MFRYPSMFRFKKKINIGFIGFWKGFNLQQFTNRHPYLQKKYKFQETSIPDYIFVSVFKDQLGTDHSKFTDSAKIFYSGENVEPDMDYYDFGISFSFTKNENHYRLPSWVPRMYANGMHPEHLLSKFRKKVKPDSISPKFCNFIFKHQVDFRERFFFELNRYKQVIAPGLSCNNAVPIGPFVEDKIEYQNQFKFSVSMENECSPGYVTEKITEAFIARTVPIYFGDPNVGTDFDNESFVNILSTNDYAKAIEKIILMDNKKSLYLKAVNSQVYTNDTLPDYAQEENIMSFFEHIFG